MTLGPMVYGPLLPVCTRHIMTSSFLKSLDAKIRSLLKARHSALALYPAHIVRSPLSLSTPLTLSDHHSRSLPSSHCPITICTTDHTSLPRFPLSSTLSVLYAPTFRITATSSLFASIACMLGNRDTSIGLCNPFRFVATTLCLLLIKLFDLFAQPSRYDN
ncbi:uncharacterized protein LOC144544119 [Carex rostrata]